MIKQMGKMFTNSDFGSRVVYVLLFFQLLCKFAVIYKENCMKKYLVNEKFSFKASVI